MFRIVTRTARASSFLLVAMALSGVPAASAQTGLEAFRARHGDHWRLARDPATNRPRRLAGGSIRWIDPALLLDGDRAATDALLTERGRAFLAAAAPVLDLDAADLRPATHGPVRVDGGRLTILDFDVAPGGVRIVGARVTLVVSSGQLVYVHAAGPGRVVADPAPAVGRDAALDAAARAAGVTVPELAHPPDVELVFAPFEGGHRLAWQVFLHADSPPRRTLVRIDARTSEVLAHEDAMRTSCAPLPAGTGHGRVLGGVRTRAGAPERTELLPFVEVGAAVAGADGVFALPPAPHAAALRGPYFEVSCDGCIDPAAPLAPVGPGPDADFGSGGRDGQGNGRATPADRAAFAHAHAARGLAARWLALPFLERRLLLRTNVAGECNASWDGRSLNFHGGSARCANTGELPDVVAHEWGHALDEHDGVRSSDLSVDAATGEAVADVIAVLLGRDPCVGETFHADPDDFPSDTCSGVRDLDEQAPGHRRGVLTTADAAAACPPSAFYRGVLGREGHCEGEILGQAFWHLVRALRTGTAVDGTPLPGGPLAEEDAWQVAERLALRALPLLASYAPSTLQSIGVSAHDAFLLADDPGDGLANGTPHAAAIHDAFAHHGLAEPDAAPLAQPRCVPPPAPVVAATGGTDPSSGLPAIALTWSASGAHAHDVLRADPAGGAFLPVAAGLPGSATSVLDRGVLPGRTYRYLVLARDASGCVSTGGAPVVATAGAALAVAAVVVDDAASGDGDGRLEEGEVADVRVTVANTGGTPLSDLRLVLDDPGVPLEVVAAGPVVAGDLAPGATVTPAGAFRVRIHPRVPRVVPLAFSGEADEGCVRASFSVEIDRRALQVDGTALLDDGGDGTWSPGEGARLDVTLRNVGELDVADLRGTLSVRGAAPPGVRIASSRATWPALAVGAASASIPPGFALEADATVPPGTRVDLALDLESRMVPLLRHELHVTVGGFPPGRLKWSRLSARGGGGGTPVVVQLDDDDGDGVVTGCDVPDVVHREPGPVGPIDRLFAVSGADGRELWRLEDDELCLQGTGDGHTLAAGDLDGDGSNEIVASSAYGHLCGVRSDGVIAWRTVQDWVATSRPGAVEPSSVQLWDLDGDGDVEIVDGATALDGATGAILWERYEPGSGRTQVGDIDLDGRAEVVTGGAGVYWPDGSTCPVGFPCNGGDGGLVNLDGDAEAEVVLAGGSGLHAWDHDGTRRWTVPLTDGQKRATCFADYDLDGLAETVLVTNQRLRMIDHDGAPTWTVPLQARDAFHPDGSIPPSDCSAFDFDGDGRAEIVVGDQDGLAIHDARDGSVLWSTGTRATCGNCIPVVADVDADGSADIVFGRRDQRPEGPEAAGVFVYSNPAWVAPRTTWNQEIYSSTHVRDDGGIPAPPPPSWLLHNTWRAQLPACSCALDLDPRVRLSEAASMTFCFSPAEPGARGDAAFEWDFGDGSPLSAVVAPCHSYATPGDYVVRVTAVTADGCRLESVVLVHARKPPAPEVRVEVACDGIEACGTVTIAHGRAPFEVQWTFGDQPPVAGEAACAALPEGAHDVTVFVRDANGALAQATQRVVARPTGNPEVSGPGAEPLRVRRVGFQTYEVTWQDTGSDANVYRGFFPPGPRLSHRPLDHYRHEAWPGACGLRGRATGVELGRGAYFLVGGAPCPAPAAVGPLGEDSFGQARPSAQELGRADCP